jgi:hypothetical protein
MVRRTISFAYGEPFLTIVFAGIFPMTEPILPFRLAWSQPLTYIAGLQTAAVVGRPQSSLEEPGVA